MDSPVLFGYLWLRWVPGGGKWCHLMLTLFKQLIKSIILCNPGLVKVGQFVRAEKLQKIGEKLSKIMSNRKVDAKFLGMLSEMSTAMVKDIMLSKNSVRIWEVSKLAAALNIDEEELAPQAASLSIESGFMGKIIGILKSDGSHHTAAVLVKVARLVTRPFWSTSFGPHYLLTDSIKIISPGSLTHIVNSRHCCIYVTLDNLHKYSNLVKALGSDLKFRDTRLDCSNTSNRYFVFLPKIGRNIEMVNLEINDKLPSVPNAEINRPRS